MDISVTIVMTMRVRPTIEAVRCSEKLKVLKMAASFPRNTPRASRFLVAISLALSASLASAGESGGIWHAVTAPARAWHRDRPPACKDDRVEQLADEIDWLEHHIDAFGSIVAKQPDVWGQSRLTRHRYEYEAEMKAQLGNFQDLNNASISRSDQSFAGLAMAMGRGDSGSTPPSFTTVQNLISNPADPNSGVIDRTAPFTTTSTPFATFGMGNNNAVSLEPNIHLDHLSDYIGHLDQLRRINEGDDTADSPGYALNLVRIPISILPGKNTQRGHGAEVTVIGEAQLGDELLPTTFRNLVVNDLVDLIAPGLTFAVNNGEVRTAICATSIGDGPDTIDALMESGGEAIPDPDRVARSRKLTNHIRKVMRSHTISVSVPTAKMRRARMPFPPEELVDVVGETQVTLMLRATFEALGGHPADSPCINYNDVRGFLGEELQAAYDFLCQPRQSQVWDELASWNLAELIRSRRMGELELRRRNFFQTLGFDEAPAVEGRLVEPSLGCLCKGPCENDVGTCHICRTSTAVLAWAILVESALLNDRLIEDMRTISASKGYAAGCIWHGPYYGPNPSAEARASFNEYVRRRWPIRIFALDPVSDEQNVEEMFSQRREMQLALAMSVAHGRSNRQTLARYDRMLQTNMATIGLNQTAVGFTHGNDTFGWRFYPRVQAPPTQNNFAAFASTVIGSNSQTRDLSTRHLEPGMRECTAIIVMPSFVPYVTFDVRSNWFSLTNPKSTDQSMRQAMKLSRSVKSMQQSAGMCAQNAGAYRDGEVARLMRRVDQLDRELPLQTMTAQIPYENTSGGFELFNTGVTDLAPELIGYYGAEGVDTSGTTVVFLVGKGFNLHDTSVIAGGKQVPVTLISRQVLRAEIPPGVQVIRRNTSTAPTLATARMRSIARPLAAGRRRNSHVVLASGTEQISTPTGEPHNPIRAGTTAPSSSSSSGDDQHSQQSQHDQQSQHTGPSSSPADSGLMRSVLPRAQLQFPLPAPTTPAAPTAVATCPSDEPCSDCCDIAEFVDVHLATPYGVSDHLLIPVYQQTSATTSATAACELSFAPDAAVSLTTTKTKTGGWRMNEFFQTNADRIRIQAPSSFVPPQNAQLQCTLRDNTTGATVATFSVPAPTFHAVEREYLLSGADLRNFVGDTSRPATDKTLRGAIKPYIDHLGSQRTGSGQPEVNCNLTLTAQLVTASQVIPIKGFLAVSVKALDPSGDAPADDTLPAGN